MGRFTRAFAIGVTAAVLSTALSGAVRAAPDKQTLADIQADLDRVKAEVDGLKQELQPTGTSAAVQLPAGSSIPDRLDAIESELQRLTSQTEELQNRVNRVVADGTNRIGDLQFRLTEALGGDTSKIGKAKPLGGGTAPPVAAPAPAQQQPATDASGGQDASSQPQELAVGELGDFDKAKAAFDANDFKKAAALFAAFAQTYTGGKLTGEALFMRGEALTQMGDTANAARAYLDSFSSYPKGPKAADALTKLGISLGKLGQTKDACTTLGQVSVRYPSSGAVLDAAQAMQSLGCK